MFGGGGRFSALAARGSAHLCTWQRQRAPAYLVIMWWHGAFGINRGTAAADGGRR
jgi:hypothetical protein